MIVSIILYHKAHPAVPTTRVRSDNHTLSLTLPKHDTVLVEAKTHQNRRYFGPSLPNNHRWKQHTIEKYILKAICYSGTHTKKCRIFFPPTLPKYDLVGSGMTFPTRYIYLPRPGLLYRRDTSQPHLTQFICPLLCMIQTTDKNLK